MSTIHPSQLRAARGLVDCSRDEIAALAGVNARTLAALEHGENSPSRSTTQRLIDVLDRLGVELIEETASSGAGVRLREPDGGAVFVRRDALSGGDEIGLIFRVGGRPATARVAVSELVPSNDADAALVKFDHLRPVILRLASGKLAAQDFDQDGHLRITSADLDAAKV